MKIKNFFKQRDTQTAVVQTSNAGSHPFYELDRYVPLANAEASLYTQLREAIPLIDAAIIKTIRLVGGFKVECDNEYSQKVLNDFLKSVQVGALSNGIESFISAYLDQLITYGTAVGEMVISKNVDDISALYLSNPQDIELRKGSNPLETTVCVRSVKGPVPVKNSEVLLLSALNATPSSPYGCSVLKGLPFVSSILLKIYNSIGLNFDRVGNLRFAVTYRPNEDTSNVREKAQAIAEEWSKAMNSNGTVSDFISVGDVDIKVIGADSQVLDTNVPVKQMLEQIVAKMGIPPFLLGLNWSSTERMSVQLCDILTSELEAYRRLLTPVILKICNTFLSLRRLKGNVNVLWDNITLLDESELAKTRLLNAQAQKLEEEMKIAD